MDSARLGEEMRLVVMMEAAGSSAEMVIRIHRVQENPDQWQAMNVETGLSALGDSPDSAVRHYFSEAA